MYLQIFSYGSVHDFENSIFPGNWLTGDNIIKCLAMKYEINTIKI